MDVIVLAIALDQFGFEILADLGEDGSQVAYGEFRQGVAPVFGNKDQMGVKGVNNVPTFANISVFSHLAPR